MSFVSCAKLNAELALKQGVLKDCSGSPLPAGTKVATCDDLADLSIADATDTIKGKVALNAGTSLPGDATNCTDALTACGLNALLTDPAGNTVINNVKALIPLATTTIPGLIEEATGEETRLGATDANKDDRAVTPGSMSYTLQTLKDYPIFVRTTSATSSIPGGQFVRFDSFGVNYTSGANIVFLAGAYSPTIASGVFVSAISGTLSAGTNSGTARGVTGTVSVGGGTNIGVYGQAINGTTNWAGYFDGNVAGGAYTTLSDATLKENVEAIDAAKALQFRNGLKWKKYELFSEQQVEIMEEVTEEVQKTDAEGNPVVDEEGNPVMETLTKQVPTGRYEVKRFSQGIKRGLIAQEVQALAASIGDFSDVVAVVGEYFTLDAQGYPVKDADGNNIVNKRLGLDYDAIQFLIAAAEQSLLVKA